MTAFFTRLMSRSSAKKQSSPSAPAPDLATSRRQGSGAESAAASQTSTAASSTPITFLKLNLDEKMVSPTAIGVEAGDLAAKERAIVEASRFTEDDVVVLLKLCHAKMMQFGLSKPGLLLPHHVSASPAAQMKLLVLYLRWRQPAIFPPASPQTSITLAPPSPQYLFETEIKYAADIHDLSEIVRFAIRHLDVETGARRAWTREFVDKERASGFTEDVWSGQPSQPLLDTLLDFLLSLSALVDSTGVSAGKLSMLLGHWLLRGGSTSSGASVEGMISAWSNDGKEIEHILLAYIRHQSAKGQIPLRLLPLIKDYPFRSLPPPVDSIFSSTLPGSPPFTTRQMPVLLVKLVSSSIPLRARPDPVYLAELAFSNVAARGAMDARSLWTAVTTAALTTREGSEISGVDIESVLSGESLRIARSVSELHPSRPPAPKGPAPAAAPMYRPFRSSSSSMNPEGEDDQISTMRPARTSPYSSHSRRRSQSHSDVRLLNSVDESLPSLSEFGMRSSSNLGTPTIGGGSDWAAFSTSGFGESPGSPSSRASLSLGETLDIALASNPKRINARSAELDRILAASKAPPSPISATTPSFATSPLKTPPRDQTEVDLSIISVDETFVEFSQDLTLEPVLSKTFPHSVMYEIKRSLAASIPGAPSWVLVAVVPPPPPPTPPPPAPPAAVIPRPRLSGADSATKRTNRRSFLGLGGLTKKLSMRAPSPGPEMALQPSATLPSALPSAASSKATPPRSPSSPGHQPASRPALRSIRSVDALKSLVGRGRSGSIAGLVGSSPGNEDAKELGVVDIAAISNRSPPPAAPVELGEVLDVRAEPSPVKLVEEVVVDPSTTQKPIKASV